MTKLLKNCHSFLLLILVLAVVHSCSTPPPRTQDDYVGPIRKIEDPAPPVSPSKTTDRPHPVPIEGPLELTIREATILAFENNREFRVERFVPPIQRTFEDEERAIFDPTLRGSGSWGRERSKSNETTKGYDANLGVSQFLPTGTWLDLALQTELERKDPRGFPDDEHETSADLTVTQALLRGAGLDVNLATLRQAGIDTSASEYELRGLAQSLLAEVENTYWDYVLAKGEVKIFTASLKLADQLTEETRERIQIGQVAESEIFSAEAEAATREQELINAVSERDRVRLRLLRLTNPSVTNLWDKELVLTTEPNEPEITLEDMQDHIQIALRMRPDLNQARLAVERGELEVVKTKNGLLPKLDLFIILGRTGYSDSFGGSVRDVWKSDGGLDFFAGLRFEYPIGNRAPKARYKRSTLGLERDNDALENLAQLVEEDVLTANIEVNRTQKQIFASAATRKYQREKLQAEIDKYRLGRSTMFRVAQAQRDLVESQISEIRARIGHIKSFTQFYFVEGSLLERRGIEAPGRVTVELSTAEK